MELFSRLQERPRRWCVTGAAGFIGSHLLEKLLSLGQHVTVLDNFATGHKHNLDAVKRSVGDEAFARCRLIEGSITELSFCRDAVKGCEHVLHQAALGSVPRSMADPIASHAANVDGFLNMLVAARDEGVKSFVYASSSSVYGDAQGLPKFEEKIGTPLSPYAATKLINEVYAQTFANAYGMRSIGLRYFNVFGPRQDPNGAYAAVIPRWVNQMVKGERCHVNGDGSFSRDFCYVDNVVQANLLASQAELAERHRVFNIAVGDRTTLNELYTILRAEVSEIMGESRPDTPEYGPERAGDVPHSLASIDRARSELGYAPAVNARSGLALTAKWFVENGAK